MGPTLKRVPATEGEEAVGECACGDDGGRRQREEVGVGGDGDGEYHQHQQHYGNSARLSKPARPLLILAFPAVTAFAACVSASDSITARSLRVSNHLCMKPSQSGIGAHGGEVSFVRADLTGGRV